MMPKKLISSIATISLIVYSFAVLMEYNASRFDHECFALKEDFRQLELHGIVTAKYLDEKNHLKPTVRLESKLVQLRWKYGQLYDQIEEGDSIFKMRGEEMVVSVRNDSTYLIDLAVDCKEFKRPFSWKNTFKNFALFFRI
ncbi:hypothetical protein H6G97_42125 [Nostoc flagelliforme FACHB-838]|uniref:Uncharacterized protein n=1 Tax=Nostoc flagelliforme FACHB-838 TaxID=2692904 RepID=A0ABR8E227_9NOSO|nr:hypothetical protein [Nostoc flagelliforme]MBD2535626.1 hypothetical protein [Nostoc flagelliforme FACHB-838]